MTLLKELKDPHAVRTIGQQQITTQDGLSIVVPGGDFWESYLFDTDITRDAPLRKSPINIAPPPAGVGIAEANSKIFDVQFTQRISGGPLPLNTLVEYYEFNDIGATPFLMKSAFVNFPLYRDIGYRAVFRFVVIIISNLQPSPNTLNIDELKIMTRIDG